MRENADARAKRLLSERRVSVLEADAEHIAAHVVGDSGTYLVTAWVEGRELSRSCECDHAAFHPYRPNCAHVKAVLAIWHPYMKGDS